MNRIPQHKASQYSEYGVVLHRFSSQGINHTPVSYAHQDDYYVFGLLTKGTACGIIDFKELHLKEGDVFLVQPGQVHRFVSSENVEGWLMMADSKFVGSEEKCAFDHFSLSASSFTMDERRKEELRQIAMLLEHRLKDRKGQKADAVVSYMVDSVEPRLADAVVPHLVEAFIAVIAEAAQDMNAQRTALSPRYAELVLSFRKMLSENLSHHRQPSYYASLLNISTVYLNEVVKKVTGMSTALYIKGEVVLQAKRLLVHTHLSVKQIADRLGVDDYAYFSRLFTQTTGITPTDFRQKNLD